MKNLKLSAVISGYIILLRPRGGGEVRLKMKRLVFAQSDENYIKLHLAGGDIAHVHGTLTRLADLLEEGSFVRVHRRFLVNLAWVASLRVFKRNVARPSAEFGGGGYVELLASFRGAERVLPVGRTYRKRLLRNL